MIPKSRRLIKTKKFPLCGGAKEEPVNDWILGSALCTYLQAKLSIVGILVQSFCDAGRGWWLQTECHGLRHGLGTFHDPFAIPAVTLHHAHPF